MPDASRGVGQIIRYIRRRHVANVVPFPAVREDAATAAAYGDIGFKNPIRLRTRNLHGYVFEQGELR